jgi:monoamine oxidase
MTQIDIAIVGAGAAGLAAAEAIAASPFSCAILEARDRIGRARLIPCNRLRVRWTWAASWLHSADRNPLAARFEARGLTIDRTPPPWERLSDSPTLPPADQIEFGGPSRPMRRDWKRPRANRMTRRPRRDRARQPLEPAAERLQRLL